MEELVGGSILGKGNITSNYLDGTAQRGRENSIFPIIGPECVNMAKG
jgi:hypothetical protein